MDALSVCIAAGAGLLVATLALVHIAVRRSRQRRDSAALAEKTARGLNIPRSLHPEIDPNVCIGSLSCLKACPEGDILGVVGGAARLVHADHCIGHGRCAAECPVDAIKLVFGTAERGVDLPEVDQYFESSRPGVHVVGELGGMGLIKNAMTQGLQVAQRLAASRTACAREAVDAVVVGAGPAGIAAAVGLRAAGLSFHLLEQGGLGGSIAHYPRHKVVMTDPVELPFHGRFGKKLMSKEDLLAGLERVVSRAKVAVTENVKVESIGGEDGAFEVTTSRGRLSARKVVLATGRRGTPRKLGVPGEQLAKVTYALTDPEQYAGRRVLVVGGGDSALEAGIQLAEEAGAEVTLSYRGEAFARCREANRSRAEALVARGRIRALLSSEVTEIAHGRVRLAVGGRTREIDNDYVVVLIGGELPLEFLSRMGVGLRRYFGEAPGAPRPRPAAAVEPAAGLLRAGLAKERAHERREWRLAVIYAAVGVALVAFLALKGWEYYPLSRLERLRSPLHKMLRPAGAWGHWVGIVATAFMLSNFLYAVRKRSRALTGLGRIRAWLDFHVFVGFMSPLVIVFHAAFQSNNGLATGTATALVIVVSTGIIGRFIYGVVPASGGRQLELADLLGGWERLRDRLEPIVAAARDPPRLRAILADATAPARRRWLGLVFLQLPASALRTRLRLRRLRAQFGSRELYSEVKDGYLRLNRMRFQIAFYGGLKRLLRGWRVFHASLAGFLVVAIAAHIAVSLYLGYGWK